MQSVNWLNKKIINISMNNGRINHELHASFRYRNVNIKILEKKSLTSKQFINQTKSKSATLSALLKPRATDAEGESRIAEDRIYIHSVAHLWRIHVEIRARRLPLGGAGLGPAGMPLSGFPLPRMKERDEAARLSLSVTRVLYLRAYTCMCVHDLPSLQDFLAGFLCYPPRWSSSRVCI